MPSEASENVAAVAAAVQKVTAPEAPEAPVVPVEETPAEPTGEASIDWADLAEFEDTPDIIDEPEVPPATPTLVEGEPAPAEAPEVAVEGETPAAPAVTETPPVEEAPQQPTPAVNPLQLSELEQRYLQYKMQQEAKAPSQQAAAPAGPSVEEIRTQALQQIAQNISISEEEAAQLTENPEVVLPQLLARAQLGAFEQSFQTIMSRVPQLVQQAVSQGRQYEETVKAFYSRWPKLVGHEQKVLQVTQAYRATNPTATVAQAIEDIGGMAHVWLKIPFADPAPAATTPASAATTPPPPPAGTGGVTTPAAPQKPVNPFAQLTEEWDREDIE